MEIDGLTTIASSFSPAETMDRIEAAIRAKGMTVFARIDHAAGAMEAGLALRPTELLIFGNAKGGTPLMQAEQTIGIDLPLKVLVWQDTAGATQVSYNRPSWLAQRHHLDASVEPTLAAMTAMLAAVTGAGAGLQACGSLPRHSGARAKRASPESIVQRRGCRWGQAAPPRSQSDVRGYGSRARAFGAPRDDEWGPRGLWGALSLPFAR